MDAVTPTAGKGTQHYPQTSTYPNPMLRVAGKPIIGITSAHQERTEGLGHGVSQGRHAINNEPICIAKANLDWEPELSFGDGIEQTDQGFHEHISDSQ